MDSHQALSVLIQIGAFAVAFCLLYGLQRLVDEGRSLGKVQMERRIAQRRRATQDHIAALKRMELDDVPLLSPELARIERALLKQVQRIEEQEFETASSVRSFASEESETWSPKRWQEAPFELLRQEINIYEEILQ